MLVLRKYQLDIIFLFFALLLMLWSAFAMLNYFGADAQKYEWFIAIPAIILYFAHLWKIRSKIALADRRNPTPYSFFYWIILGIVLFASYSIPSAPLRASDYLSIEILYIIFTLLLADSYWDFKKISLKSFKDKRELR